MPIRDAEHFCLDDFFLEGDGMLWETIELNQEKLSVMLILTLVGIRQELAEIKEAMKGDY